MTETSITFKYLDEPTMIRAGVADMASCVETMEEALILLQSGDYRMTGASANSHGAMISFPKSPEFDNMPQDGPDRRFMAMPAYLGGRFHATGTKWYGSNLENRSLGLPRSILLYILNDTDTGAPLAVMSANLLSAYRTGAVPGVAVKHLAKRDSKTLGLIGPGVIGRAVTEAALSQRPSIEQIVVKGADEADVERFKTYASTHFGDSINVVGAGTEKEVVESSDIVSVTVTTAGSGSKDFPYIDHQWIKPGTLMLNPAAVRYDDSFLTSPDTRLVVDYWGLYEAWSEEYGAEAYEKLGIIGTHFHNLVDRNEADAAKIEEIASIANGNAPGRTNDDEIIVYSAGGIPVEDVAWASDVYRNAVDLGLGTDLSLWDSPELA